MRNPAITPSPHDVSSPATAVTGPGHPASVWSKALRGRPRMDLDALRRLLGVHSSFARLMVIAAHPDDETIGAGRLIAQWSRTTERVTAVLATLGEACLDQVGPRPAGLGRRRLAEWHAALDRLGVPDRHVLGLRDGQLSASADQLQARLAKQVRAVLGLPGGRDTVLVAPLIEDPHPDHAAAGQAALAVARQFDLTVLGYPVWLTYWATPEEVSRPLLRIGCDAEAERTRQAALACFDTQLRPSRAGVGPVVPAELLDHHHEQLITVVRRRRR